MARTQADRRRPCNQGAADAPLKPAGVGNAVTTPPKRGTAPKGVAVVVAGRSSMVFASACPPRTQPGLISPSLPCHATELHQQHHEVVAHTRRAPSPSSLQSSRKPASTPAITKARHSTPSPRSSKSRLSAPTTTAAKSPPPHDLHSNPQLRGRSRRIDPPRRWIRGPKCCSRRPGALPRGMPLRRRERPRRRLPRGHRTSGDLLLQQRKGAAHVEGAQLPAGDAATRVAPAGATREPCDCCRGVNCICHAFGVNI
jgi:hypothetical protein